jgi:hypothetical protein
MIINGDCGQVNVCGIVQKFFLNTMMKIFRDKNVLIKGQGACVKIRRKNHG